MLSIYANVATVSLFFAWFQFIGKSLSIRLCKKYIPSHYERLSDEDKKRLASRMMSSLNSTFVVVNVSAILVLNWQRIRSDPYWADTFVREPYCCINLAYFLSDMINDLRGKRNFSKIIFLIHHSMVLSAISIVIYYRVFLFHICMRGLNELSTPVLNLRWVLKKFGMENEGIYAMTEIAFVVTYFSGRIVTMPVFYCTILITKDTEGYQRLNTLCKVIFFGSSVVIDTLIIYWFLLICKMVFNNVKERTQQIKGKEE
uniref:TLC domain-containing protein 4-B-like isoform X1 n=1 Tax=Styela clava TaxID=7725 RepID=UPI00193929D0|nr:TLC domain-containing protein 4-B-like isoform X1 [Styela clava]